MTLRPYAATAAVAALLLSPVVTAPAQAVPPLNVVIDDATEPTTRAFDITLVKLRSAPDTRRPAVVLVTHGRMVRPGDSIDVWFDLDGDKVPDLHVSGDAFSEFTVHKTHSFTKDGKDISDQDVARLSMARFHSKIRLFPSKVGSPLSFSVVVKSSRSDKPARTDDWAPSNRKFSRPVLAAPLT